MEKKQLYMIGNSHIDPVWFWEWEEGMQEVKSTFLSALDRMREFEDYKFTSTSTAFFKWVEKLLPDQFEEIRQRISEGRWEITGGWFIEPDCLLPCGEAFVRLCLYGQRYLKSRFGEICRIGSNVDSFGHNGNLPQILRKSGMDAYIFMRPRLDMPVFNWEGPDGSRVRTICLPAEYTTWFREPTLKNIHDTLERTKAYDKMVCCYGVGNHGGGPTIENIETICGLQENFEAADLHFASFGEFLEDCREWDLPLIKGPFEKINVGCYSVDSEFKRINRLAEQRLITADTFLAMAVAQTGEWLEETGQMESLWEILHFNEFHDIMGGTTIKPARDEAVMQLSAVCAKAGAVRAAAIQRIVNSQDTRGEGSPLFLFTPHGRDFCDYVEAEVEWFCQSPLKLLDPLGNEIPYQRIHTAVKVRHTVLGGRRRIVFRASIPSCGYAVYRLCKEEPTLCFCPNMEIENPDPYKLENPFLKAEFDRETGMLCGLTDKTTGYNAFKGASSVRLYLDERDDWGGLQGRRYEDRDVSFHLESMDKVESGGIRETIRVRLAYEDTKLELLYSLGAEEKELRVEYRLRLNHTWALIKIAYPTGEDCLETRAESAYWMVERNHKDDDGEYNMQRFLDTADGEGRGLAVANGGKYAFNVTDGRTQVTVARSAIYAQGNSPDWENEIESYEYTDIGMQTFQFVLKPHGKRLPASELYRLGDKANGPYEYLMDSAHGPMIKGGQGGGVSSFAGTDQENVAVQLVKKAEDDEAYVIRLLELEGKDTDYNLSVQGKQYPLAIGHHEIQTVKLDKDGKRLKLVSLLEWDEEKK